MSELGAQIVPQVGVWRAADATAPTQSAWRLVVLLSVVVVSAWLFAALLPLTLSMVAVLLFAGPHNWVEARYFLSRLPARFGKLKSFFLLGMVGVLSLTTFFAILPVLARYAQWSDASWCMALAIWNSLLISWVAGLTWMRSHQAPRKQWPWILPTALLVCGLAWLAPGQCSLAWVYAHPLMGLWILDREIHRSHRPWMTSYRRCVTIFFMATIGLVIWLWMAEPLQPQGPIESRIVNHSGAMWFPGVSSRVLVGLHSFLELTHYGVWLLAIPYVSGRVWRPVRESIPFAKRGASYRYLVYMLLGIGGLFVIALWCGFMIDYATTRDLYFTVAMIHVLAEVPFLLRSL